MAKQANFEVYEYIERVIKENHRYTWEEIWANDIELQCVFASAESMRLSCRNMGITKKPGDKPNRRNVEPHEQGPGMETMNRRIYKWAFNEAMKRLPNGTKRQVLDLANQLADYTVE
jgi:hypothetical protein